MSCAFVLSVLAAITGCSDDAKLEGAPVELNVDGHVVAPQTGDCRIYKVKHSWLGTVRKTRVLSTGFYLGFTVCAHQSLRKEGDCAIASVCRQAVGAGGECVASGTYRTRDGIKWEKDAGAGKWVPVEPADDAPATTSAASPPATEK